MVLIASGTVRGRCPVCGAANFVCKGSHESGDGIVIREAETVSGPLVTVQIRPGLGIKITEAEARRLGYLPAAKEREQAPNKARRRPSTKGRKADE